MLRVALLYTAILLAPRCSHHTCAQRLYEKDQVFLAQTDALLVRGIQMDTLDYLSELKAMRQQEEQLFEEVRACNFEEDLTNYNYWYRARLKFPSRLEQELRRLDTL